MKLRKEHSVVFGGLIVGIAVGIFIIFCHVGA